jgi:putative N6-adenine-specific DNA methylase
VNTRQRFSKAPDQLSAFAVTAPGLEPLCAAELERIGIDGKAVDGGVAWTGDLESVMRANLWSRTASRVLVRVAEFKAKAFFELELNAKKIPFKRFVAPGGSAEFRVTARKSKLYHTGAITQRLGDALTKSVKGATLAKTAAKPASNADDEDESPAIAQLFVVRFVHDVATVSVDSSGALLHRRGYRQALAKAPLRETLAAAVLLGADWNGTTPLTDPMCGSGTIPIEGALIARRIPPGRDRDFAFMRWPEFDRAAWERLLGEAKSAELPKSPVAIQGFDRDEGAIAAARSNAERAGVAADIELVVQPVSAISAADGAGLLATNPPYGVRVGDSDALRNLYAQIGNVMRARRKGWRVALLSADKQLERQTKIELASRFATSNGGIPVRLMVGDVD